MALPVGSPARNAGAGCPATDQRGVARPQGSACDIGAYEAVERLLLSPEIVFVGDKGFTLRVTGEGFTSGSKIVWKGSARPTTFATSTTLTTAVAASELSAPATISISVSGSALPAATFRVLPLGGHVYVPVVVR
jgi:hypothetical protein